MQVRCVSKFIPMGAQLLFALLYAVQSDILPIFDNLPSNPVLRYGVTLSYLLPVISIVLLVGGFSYYLIFVPLHFEDVVLDRVVSVGSARQFAVTLMGVGGVALSLILLTLMIAFLRWACVYYDDWTQMAADHLAVWYPETFGKPPDKSQPEDPSSEDDAERAERAPKDKEDERA